MKKLAEIVDQALEGEMPSHEDCFYAMLAYRALFVMDHQKLMDALMLGKPGNPAFKKLFAENSNKALKDALNKPPREWLGPNWDPMTQECKKMHKIHQKIYDNFLKHQEKEQQNK